ncbi:MAG: hypothetical protein AAF632_04755 [Bacteroidota bacterium]
MEEKFFYWTVLTCIIMCISCSSSNDGIDQPLNSVSFGREMEVTINDLSFDAMEPFISPDGRFLFFNSLNDGINTKIYYAERVNDSVFDFSGELTGTNQIAPPHLDAVPNMDANGNFYWTSTRNYPTNLDNLFHGSFDNGVVKNIGRVQGDFYKNIPGWLVMDHGISVDGQFLYFNNARFDNSNCQGPCETELGIAQKLNDSTFTTLSESSSILQTVNDPNYIYYAPHLSSDNLELYFTRYLKGPISPETIVEICVAVRSKSTNQFSEPRVLFSDVVSKIIEAPTLTLDKAIMYYHRKMADTHKIVMRYRNPE